MSPYEPPGYRIIPTPAFLSRSDTAVVPSWESQTAWLTPTAVTGTVARPARPSTSAFVSASGAAAARGSAGGGAGAAWAPGGARVTAPAAASRTVLARARRRFEICTTVSAGRRGLGALPYSAYAVKSV